MSERALLGSERRFTTVFQNAPIGISLTTVHGAKILNVNERYCQLVGYPREALLGRSTVELGILDPAVRSRLMDAALGGNRAPQEVRLRAASGELCEALVAVEIQDLDGEACALSMYLDLSARRRLEREVLEVAAREQRRLAQDLHDGLGSHLTGVAMLARGLARAARRGEAVAPEQIEEIAGLVQEGIEQARALARGLDPVQIEGEGLAPALHRLAAETGRRAQTACTLELSEPLPDLRGAAAVHLYRIAQEALTNAARHARADHLAVRLGVEGNLLRLEVEDDGRGIPEACTKGMGLQTMRYRANLIGATLDVASAPGRGTRVTCRLPLADLDPPSEA
ncbi:MAG TPA: PAS domain-containing sensor histidine kinase [Rubricoccaceae bacterium]|nr:PAS domain-containing sensor histidine kinase [Rubricoccaceae bacterium]